MGVNITIDADMVGMRVFKKFIKRPSSFVWQEYFYGKPIYVE